MWTSSGRPKWTGTRERNWYVPRTSDRRLMPTGKREIRREEIWLQKLQQKKTCHQNSEKMSGFKDKGKGKETLTSSSASNSKAFNELKMKWTSSSSIEAIYKKKQETKYTV